MLEDDVLLARIRRIMRHTRVDRKAGRESHSSLHTISRFDGLVPEKSPHAILNPGCDLSERLSGLHGVLDPVPDLPVNFSGFAIVVQQRRIVEVVPVKIPQLLGRRARRGEVMLVVEELASGIIPRGEQLTQRDARRRRLDSRSSLLLVLLLGLSLSLLLAVVDGADYGGRLIVVVVIIAAVPEAAIAVAREVRAAGLAAG